MPGRVQRDVKAWRQWNNGVQVASRLPSNPIFLKLHGLVLQRLLLKGWDYWLLVLWKLDIP
jgi:hypothetical protein